jgi:hypothetical protein
MTLARSRLSAAAVAAAVGAGLALAASAGAAAEAAAEAQEKAILAAARAAENKLDIELCSYGFLQYDKTQPLGTFALFRDRKAKDSTALSHAIFQTDGKSWSLTVKEGGLYGTTCTGTGDVPKPPLRAQRATTLPISDVDEGRVSTLSVTLYDRRLVYTEEQWRKPDPPSNQSWELLRYVYEGSDEDPDGHHKYGTLLVLPKGSPARKTVPKIETFVVHGAAPGRGDAELDVAAELVGDAVELQISVTDDKDVPLRAATASDADLLRSDHLEIWYQHGYSMKDIRQLAVARLPDGKVHARWLYPRKVTAPLPKVSSPAPGRFVVQFPAGALFHLEKFDLENGCHSPFAAAFSDTDDPRNRQETVVATSTLKWGKPETFGQIVWLENGARFPPFPEGSRVELAVTAP